MIQQLFLHFFLPWNHLKALFLTEIFMFLSEINRSKSYWWVFVNTDDILVLEMFTNIVQITNIFFKINYFAFSQVSITKSYNSKISLIHLHNIFEKPNIQPYVFKNQVIPFSLASIRWWKLFFARITSPLAQNT